MQTRTDAWNWEAARQRCLREARRHTRCEADAQDAVQSAMLLAWRGRGGCRTPDDPIPWMLAITRREAWRARPSVQTVELDGQLDGQRATLDEADAVVQRLDLQAAIADLDGEQRELLRLRYDEDLTQPQLAQRLGIPEGTAKVRLHRARTRLRTTLTRS
jgi:RNA polymerase sigma-70 factor (ECF subfamily)